MNPRTAVDRLRAADPAAGRHVVDNPELCRARVEAILGSTSPDPLAALDRPSRPRYRRGVALAVAALLVPCAALATNAVFSARDVERGLPAGAKLLAGTDPVCSEVERDVVYDCRLAVAPKPGGVTAVQPNWRGSVSLMVDRDDRINGGCRSQTADGTAWRCYIGHAAADQRVLAPELLGNPMSARCTRRSAPFRPPMARSHGAAPGSAIILCGSRNIIGFAARTEVSGSRR